MFKNLQVLEAHFQIKLLKKKEVVEEEKYILIIRGMKHNTYK